MNAHDKNQAYIAGQISFPQPGTAPIPSAPPSYDEALGINQPPAEPYRVPVARNVPVVHPPHQQIPLQAPAPIIAPPQPQVLLVNVGPTSARIQCPHCHKNIKTSTKHSYQKSAHIAALVLCFLGCCFCFCIPYCLKSFRNIHHKCPECNGYIGTYQH